MQNIHIKRYNGSDEELEACIEPEDRSWQLLVDKSGCPRLIIQTKVEDDDGKIVHGYLAIEDLLPDDLDIPTLMKSTFGGRLPPEEEAKMEASFQSKAPCPR